MRAAVPGATGSPPVDSASAQVDALLLQASSRGVPSNSGGESLPRPGPTPAARRAIANAARADAGHKEGDRKEGLDPAGRAHPGLHLWAPSVPPQQSVSALDRLGVWGLEHAGPSRGRVFVSAEAEREHPLGEVCATRRGKWATASPGTGARGILGRRAARSAPGHRRRRGAMFRVAGPGRRDFLEPSPRSHSLRPPLGKGPAAGCWACPSDRSPAASGPVPDQSS